MTAFIADRSLKVYLTSFFLLLLTIAGKSQNTDPEGYYISLNKDTITGTFPHYKESSHNPASIVFLAKGSSQTIKLLPDSCLAISIQHSDTWLSYHGQRLLNATSLWNMGPNPADKYEQVTVFLRELYNDGNYKLYSLADQNRNNFYVAGDTIKLEELYFKVVMRGDQAVDTDAFKQQLVYLFHQQLDAKPGLEHRLNMLQYSEPDLTKFFRAATGIKNERPEQKTPAQIIVGLGASLNYFNGGASGDFYYTATGKYKTTVAPFIQAGLRIPIARTQEKLYLTFLLEGSYYKNTGSSDRFSESYKATLIELPLGIGYKFIKRKDIALAVEGGLTPTLLLNHVNEGVHYTNSTTFHNDLKSFYLARFLGLEFFACKKASFVVNYYFTNTVSNYSTYVPQRSSVQIGVRYAVR